MEWPEHIREEYGKRKVELSAAVSRSNGWSKKVEAIGAGLEMRG